ncbi:MAG: PAC2 family protein [Planctomycetaceae bacterium]
MAEIITLNRPWLVAVWPGMGSVALSAGYYLLAKLGMRQLGEIHAGDLFDVDHIEVRDGLIHTVERPRNRLFVCDGCTTGHDIILFIGDAQPPGGKYAFCQKLIRTARDLGVERVFTFASMATQMHPEHRPRVFGAATDSDELAELHQLEVRNLEGGVIGGLNGVLLAAAMDDDLPGACLLGEIPHLFAQAPFPRAALAVLEVFTTMAKVDIDFSELAEQAKQMEQRLGEVLAQIENAIRQHRIGESSAEDIRVEDEETPGLPAEDQQHLEELFKAAAEDRSRAYELKRELDRLEVFNDYEDRFLDLFRE